MTMIDEVRALRSCEAYANYRRAVEDGKPHEQVMYLLRIWLRLDNVAVAEEVTMPKFRVTYQLDVEIDDAENETEAVATGWTQLYDMEDLEDGLEIVRVEQLS